MAQLLYNTAVPEFTSVDLKEVVLGAASSGELPSFLFIVPTQRRRRELERILTTEYFANSSTPIVHLPFHTLGSFAAELYKALAPERREVSPELQIALMDRAMRSVDLNYYAQAGRDPSLGVVEAVTRVISGVRADGIMPSDFARDIEFAEAEPERAKGYDLVKLRDLQNIYTEYLRLLGEAWIDYPGRLLGVNTAMFSDRDALFRRAFPRVSRIFIDGFNEFTEPEISLLQQLGYVTDLNVMITFDYARENGPLYGNFEDAVRKLVVTGYRQLDLDPLAIDIPEEERRPFRHHMRKNLFRTDDRIQNYSFDTLVNVYGFHNRGEEVQGIAAYVKWLVTEQGVDPERICVTAYDMRPYTSLFREQLAAYGIPANVVTQFPLELNALVTALFSALNIPVSNYDRREVLRAVTSPYLSFGNVDPAALTEASTRLRITRGTRSWNRRILSRIDFLSSRLMHAADEDLKRSIEIELETLHRAAGSFTALVAALDEFDRRLTPAGFRAAFLKLIARLRVTENILRLRRDLESRPRTPQDWQRIHDEIERDTRALAEFLQLLDELTEFFEQEYGADTAEALHPLEFYLDHLRTACARSLYQIREKHDYGLLVAPISQLRGLAFDVVILCGLVDGEFPSTYVPENFLGKPLPGAEERKLRRERIEFYSAITSFRHRLVMTYPRFVGEKELVRSSFLDAFLRITMVEDSGRAIALDEMRVMREKIRREVVSPVHLEFIPPIATWEGLAEEAGRVLWSGQEIPDIDDARETLTNLRHTAIVERDRLRARVEEDDQYARPWRGMIEESLDAEEKEKLDERRDDEYSISQLELYARCPFKYFASRLLGVHATADYDVTLTPLERGALLHTVLFRLYTELREQDALPIEPEGRNEALARAREIAREEIAGIVFDHPYWRIDQERLLGGDLFGGLLEQWIDCDVSRGEERSRLIPGFFETSFGAKTNRGGSDEKLSSSDRVLLHNISVRGKVDRVEIYRRGDELFYAVADYKTGAPPSRSDVREGLSLQLMIYLEVVRHTLASYYDMPLEKVKPVGGIYYRLHAREMEAKESYLFVPEKVKKDIIDIRRNGADPQTVDELEDLIRQAFTFAEEYVAGIAGGSFHLTTHDVNKVCRDCEYQSVCRIWEGR